jgi:hypothetical protein
MMLAPGYSLRIVGLRALGASAETMEVGICQGCLRALPWAVRPGSGLAAILPLSDVSVFLTKQGRGTGRSTQDILNAVLDFAEASRRFRGRVPVRTRRTVLRQGDHHRL